MTSEGDRVRRTALSKSGLERGGVLARVKGGFPQGELPARSGSGSVTEPAERRASNPAMRDEFPTADDREKSARRSCGRFRKNTMVSGRSCRQNIWRAKTS